MELELRICLHLVLLRAIDCDDRKHSKGRRSMPDVASKLTYTIDTHNAIAAHGEAVEPAVGVLRFTSHEELEALAADWPTSRLLDIWNQFPGNSPVKKFTDRQTATRRIWRLLEANPTTRAARPVRQTKHGKPGAKARSGSQLAGTKSETVLALLRRPGGATLKAVMAATGWQAHSVRGFISGQLSKKMRLKVKSVKREGERVYSIRS